MIRYVTIKKFCELSRYSEDAVKAKKRDGVWREGAVWVKAPDHRILINLDGYERWVERGPAVVSVGSIIPSPPPLMPTKAKGESPRPRISGSRRIKDRHELLDHVDAHNVLFIGVGSRVGIASALLDRYGR